jgi:hypothetical protein
MGLVLLLTTSLTLFFVKSGLRMMIGLTEDFGDALFDLLFFTFFAEGDADADVLLFLFTAAFFDDEEDLDDDILLFFDELFVGIFVFC